MKNESPLVSIMVPVYNHEAYILDCISSILEQDYPAIDLIVINDGSTDSTEEKIRDFIKSRGERFRFVSKKNEGLVKTLNLGLRLSKGKYFCELASDDMLLRGSVRKRVEYMEANPECEAVFADAYLLDGSTPTTIKLLPAKKSEYASSSHSIENILKGDSIILFSTGMIRKSVMEELGEFDEDFRFYEDISMKYTLALRGKVGFLDEPVMYYRRHATNVSKTFKLRTREEKVLALEKLLAEVSTGRLKRLVRGMLFKEYVKYFKAGMDNGVEKEKLIGAFKKTLRMQPHLKGYKSAKLLWHLTFLMLRGR